MQTINQSSQQMATELLKLGQQLAASQLSVQKLRRLIDQNSTSLNIDELIGQLVDENYHDGAQALAIAAGLSGLNVNAHCLTGILPLANDIRGLPLLIHLSRGDRETALLDTIESETMSWERTALVLLFLADNCQDNPPRRLLAAMRTLARQPLAPEASTLLGLASRLINDPEVNKVAAGHLKMLRFIDEKPLKHQLNMVRQPSVNDLPERDPASVIEGRTVVREGAKVGRNEPCPCGSGKKYKKCCLGKAQPASTLANSDSAAEQPGQDSLGWKMTRSQFSQMRIQELCRQDLPTLPTGFLISALSKFCQYNHWDHARRVLNEMSGRDDLPYSEALDDYRHELIFAALKHHEVDYAREQIELLERPDALDENVRLQIKLHDPDQNILQELNDSIQLQLREQDHIASVDLAHALLSTFPALGIFFARGALSSKCLLDSEVLLETIEEARDALQLPAGDESQELFDRISEQGVDERLLRHAEQAASQDQQGAVRETEMVREQYRASRQRIKDLEATLLDKESNLKELLNRPDQSISKEREEDARAGSDSPDPQVLRSKIAELKALHDIGNKERRKLRRQLLEATNRMVETSAVETSNSEPYNVIENMEPLESQDPDVAVARRFPVFSSSARKSMQKIPIQVTDAAMQSVAELTSAGAAGWSSVKRLKGAPGIFSQRIGIHYRLLFSLDPASDELIVQELIHRRDLEKAVKRYAG